MSRMRSTKAKQKSMPQNVENTINFQKAVKSQLRDIQIIPKSRRQEQYVVDLFDDNKTIVVATGPAGTGKTYLAMMAAVKNLRQGRIDQIVLTRPAVTVEEEKHGFLPGDITSKMEPWTRPLLDVLREYYNGRDIARMLDDQTLEISPLAYMRGRTFKNAWIVADEMQNATPAQMKMLLTRIGYRSKVVVTGDIEQTDRMTKDNGLLDLVSKSEIGKINALSVNEFDHQDIQRHPIIEKVLNLYR